ncbi:MAG: tRNA(His) guanylyltransferase Thg1 family protein [Pseudomonadota bacterium]
MADKTGLGDRMKRQYEDRTRFMLPRRTYTILRADGKAFHTYTRHCKKPHDTRLATCLDIAAIALCREVQGALIGYVQSDEISVVLQDFALISTEAWFDGNLQKMVSVGASTVTAAFNVAAQEARLSPLAMFDCRAFVIPDPVEVENYLIWRQQDATRNSIQGLAQVNFSPKRLLGVNTSQMQEMLFTEYGLNWNDLPSDQKRGRTVIYSEERWQIDYDIPVFTANREYLTQRLIPHQRSVIPTMNGGM